MAIKQHSKMIIKRSTVSGEVPILGPSTDHADGTWTALGIYTGEFFYNIPDNRLWIGGEDDVVEIPLSQVFEMTYAEAQLQKNIDGSPSGDGLVIGAIYKITDRGNNGLILTAIALDKFSNYCDELIASPEEHIPALYDFDNDVLTYPVIKNYIEYVALITQAGTNAPVVDYLINDDGLDISFTYSSAGAFIVNSGNNSFTDFRTTCDISHTNNGIISAQTQGSTPASFDIQTFNMSGVLSNDMLQLSKIEIRVYN